MKYCPKCGAATRPNQKFCGSCGAPLSSTPPQAQASWPPVQARRRKIRNIVVAVVLAVVLLAVLGVTGWFLFLRPDDTTQPAAAAASGESSTSVSSGIAPESDIPEERRLYLENLTAVSGMTLTIDGVPYTFDSNGAMVENTLGEVTLGRWEGSVFINDWSNIRLTLPQGFINFDSDFMTDFSDSEAVVDMLSMKNKNCAVMVFYTVNTDGDDMDQMTAFLNMFYGGSTDMDGLGRIDTVKVGDLEYLRCFFSASQEDPQTGYLYIRNLGSHYSVIATISDTDNLPVIDSVLSTLTTAH